MKKHYNSILISLISSQFVFLSACTNSINQVTKNSPEINIRNFSLNENKLLVRFNEDVSSEQIKQLNQENRINTFKIISGDLNLVEINLPNDVQIDKIKKIYNQNSLVKYAIVIFELISYYIFKFSMYIIKRIVVLR